MFPANLPNFRNIEIYGISHKQFGLIDYVSSIMIAKTTYGYQMIQCCLCR